MNKTKPIILHLPVLLITEINCKLIAHTPLFKYKIEYFYYVLNHLSIQQNQQKDNDFYSLNISHLKKVAVSNIDQYIKYLEKVKILLSDNIYQVGKKSKYYKINEDYLKGLHTQIEIEPKTRLHTKITEDIRRKRAHYSRLEPHLSVMQKELLKLDFDYTGALKWINENAKGEVKKMSYINSIQALKDKRFRYFKRNNKNKRLDTNITNLKGELKQFIKGDHTVIDVCNSQPFLLAILIENIINNNRDTYCCYLQEETIVKTFGIKRIKRISIFNQNEEKQDLVNFSMFYNSVLNGSLYEDFIAHYGNGVNRKDVKIILFKVLFSSNKKQNLIPFKDEKNVFKSVYPFIYDCIYNFKKDDKKNNLLPIYLQRLESYLFIDCIAKELVQNGIVPLTVHDSVIIPTKYKEKALDIIKGVVLKELGVMPSFNIESLKPLPNELRLAI